MKTNVVTERLYTDECALRRVVERRASEPRKPIALFEDLVDLMLCPLAESRRPAGA